MPIDRVGLEGIGFFPNLTLRASPIFEVNDPTECSLGFCTPGDESELGLFTEDVIHIVVESALEGLGDVNARIVENHFQHAFNREYGILCLSRFPDLKKMWSYYASNHTGFAVGLDENALSKRFKSYKKDGTNEVIIKKRIPLIPKNVVNGRISIPVGYAYCKTEEWMDECETRFIIRNDQMSNANLIHLGENSIKEIVFGLNMSFHISAAICQIFLSMGFKNLLFKRVDLTTDNKLKLCNTSFDIERRLLNTRMTPLMLRFHKACNEILASKNDT